MAIPISIAIKLTQHQPCIVTHWQKSCQSWTFEGQLCLYSIEQASMPVASWSTRRTNWTTLVEPILILMHDGPMCQSKWIGTGLAELSPILEQSNANFVPFTRAIPALNQGTSPLWRLVSSPLGGQIQGKRAFPILTNPFKCWPAYANPGQPNCQSLANP